MFVFYKIDNKEPNGRYGNLEENIKCRERDRVIEHDETHWTSWKTKVENRLNENVNTKFTSSWERIRD